jgi:hypothetical protein
MYSLVIMPGCDAINFYQAFFLLIRVKYQGSMYFIIIFDSNRKALWFFSFEIENDYIFESWFNDFFWKR